MLCSALRGQTRVLAVYSPELLRVGSFVVHNPSPRPREVPKRREIPPPVTSPVPMFRHHDVLAFPERPLDRISQCLNAVLDPRVPEPRKLDDASLTGEPVAVDEQVQDILGSQLHQRAQNLYILNVVAPAHAAGFAPAEDVVLRSIISNYSSIRNTSQEAQSDVPTGA